MYRVVSNDKRIPPDLNSFRVESWTVSQFLKAASVDDGLTIDEGLWYDVADITQEVYDVLEEYKQAYSINIVYYRFADRQPSAIVMTDPTIVQVYPVVADNFTQNDQPIEEFNVEQPVVEQPVVEQPVTEPVVPEPVVPDTVIEPIVEVQPVPQPVPVTPVVQTPIQPVQQPPTYQTPSFNDFQLPSGIEDMLKPDDPFNQSSQKKTRKHAKTALVGSSKGGSGKTTTSAMLCYQYATEFPNLRVAYADFDIIDGQVGVCMQVSTPTMQDFYHNYCMGKKTFEFLANVKQKPKRFPSNVDVYLAPSQVFDKLIDDYDFWLHVITLLLENYDMVFFDTGIDYMRTKPISYLYKICDNVFVVTCTAVGAVKSVNKQLANLGGIVLNNVYRPKDEILKRTKVVITRVDYTPESVPINEMVKKSLKSNGIDIVCEFGNIDPLISQLQWYQRWELLDKSPEVIAKLDQMIAVIEGGK